MKAPRSMLCLMLLGLPAVAAGYAYTAATADGSFKQNQTSGQPIVWSFPQQLITLNFAEPLNASARNAMAEWNGVNTALQFQADTPGDVQTCGSDDRNSAGFGSRPCGGANPGFGDALAITRRSYSNFGGSWHLSEADIVLDSSRTWAVYSGDLRPGVQDFHRVMLHELGHALGLDHPDDAKQQVVAIMNSRTSNLESLQSDDRSGVIALYSGSIGASNNANQSSGEPGGGGGGATEWTLLALLAWGIGRSRGARAPRQ